MGIEPTICGLRYRCSAIEPLWLEETRKHVERETGLEPATSSLGRKHSTAELLSRRCTHRASATFCEAGCYSRMGMLGAIIPLMALKKQKPPYVAEVFVYRDKFRQETLSC